MMSSSGEHTVSVSEEDIHQCGRCKRSFHSIEQYFDHKQVSCRKQRASSRQANKKIKAAGSEQELNNTAGSGSMTDCEDTDDFLTQVSTINLKDDVFPKEMTKCAVILKKLPSDHTEYLSSTGGYLSGNDYSNKTSEDEDEVPNTRVLRKRKTKSYKPWLCDTLDLTGDDEKIAYTPKSLKRQVSFAENLTECEDNSETQNKRGRSSTTYNITPAMFQQRKKEYACPACDYKAHYKDEFDRHLRRMHSLSHYICENCHQPFRDKYKLKRHLDMKRCSLKRKQTAKGKEAPLFMPFTTRNRTKKFVGGDDVPGASSTEIKQEPVDPVEGDASTSTQDAKPIPGEFAAQMSDGCVIKSQAKDGKSSVKVENESGHILAREHIHFTCKFCVKEYDTYDALMAHMQFHPDSIPGVCRYCGKWFKSKYRLWRHLTSSIHDYISDVELQHVKAEVDALKITWDERPQGEQQKRVFRCELCREEFPSRVAHLKHFKTKHKDKASTPYVCEQCGAHFVYYHYLRKHKERLHTGNTIAPTQCPVCLKLFKQKTHVMRHMDNLHTPSQQMPVPETKLVAEQSNACPPIPQNEGQIASMEPVPSMPPLQVSDMNEAPPQFTEQGGPRSYLMLEGDADPHPSVTEETGAEKIMHEVHTCCVCLKNLGSWKLYKEHLQLHRVWVPTTEPFDKDLFEAFSRMKKGFSAKSLLELQGEIPPPTIDGVPPNDGQIQPSLTSDSSQIDNASPAVGANITSPNQIQQSPTAPVTDTSSPQQQQQQQQQHHDTIDQLAFSNLLNPAATSAAADLGMLCDVSLSQANAGGPLPIPNNPISSEVSMPQPGIPTTQPIMEVPTQLGTVIPIKEEPKSRESSQEREVPDECIVPCNEEGDGMAAVKTESCGKEPAGAMLMCPYCLKLFGSLQMLYDHKTGFHNLELKFRCIKSDCRALYNDAEDYLQHSKEHAQNAFICSVCNEHFEEMAAMQAHKGAAHRVIHFVHMNRCHICNVTFPSRDELQKHTAMGEDHYPCKQCGKVFRSLHERRDHELIHTGIKNLLCDKCGATFANRTALYKHKSSHYMGKTHTCSHCGKLFNKREHLMRHVKTIHTEGARFVCQSCNKAFKRKDKLHEHLKTHSLDRPHECGQCGRKYRYREGLKYHEKSHLKDKKYECTVCQMPFIRPGQLRSHLFEAHNIKTKEQHIYPCSHCPASFCRPERVKRHMERDHMMQINWDYRCEICNHGFVGYKSLKSHLAKKHGPEAVPPSKRKKKEKKSPHVGTVITAMIDAAVKDNSSVLQLNASVTNPEQAVLASVQTSEGKLIQEYRILPGQQMPPGHMQAVDGQPKQLQSTAPLSSIGTSSCTVTSSNCNMLPPQPAHLHHPVLPTSASCHWSAPRQQEYHPQPHAHQHPHHPHLHPHQHSHAHQHQHHFPAGMQLPFDGAGHYDDGANDNMVKLLRHHPPVTTEMAPDKMGHNLTSESIVEPLNMALNSPWKGLPGMQKNEVEMRQHQHQQQQHQQQQQQQHQQPGLSQPPNIILTPIATPASGSMPSTEGGTYLGTPLYVQGMLPRPLPPPSNPPPGMYLQGSQLPAHKSGGGHKSHRSHTLSHAHSHAQTHTHHHRAAPKASPLVPLTPVTLEQNNMNFEKPASANLTELRSLGQFDNVMPGSLQPNSQNPAPMSPASSDRGTPLPPTAHGTVEVAPGITLPISLLPHQTNLAVPLSTSQPNPFIQYPSFGTYNFDTKY